MLQSLPNNKATGYDSYGGAIFSVGTGNVTNCNFIGNNATFYGGAIYFSSSGTTHEVRNCNFTNNSATKNGGAVYFLKTGNVTNCNFADNSASNGRDIYSYLWSTADTCIFKSSDTTVNIDIFSPTLNVGNFTTFYGFGEKLTFDLKTNSNIPVTNGNISISVYFKNNDNWVRNYTCLSGEGWIPDLSVGSYYAIFNTEYAGFQPINRTVEITIPKIKYYINVTSLTTNNKTVNITAKSNIPKDILWDGKLLFILPNTNSITANYAGNGTWWALHTFDDYAVYEVNATYTGLDNVTINNATITISRANSTLTVDDIVFDYNTIGSTTVSYTGATGINASVINQSNAKVNVDGNTITVSGLNAGTYTLSVTTMADADHNNVTKTANITVNKLDSTLTVDNIVFDYNSAGYTLVSFSDASGVNASVVGQPNAIVRVVGNVITVSGLNAGTYSLSVTTITDANHNSLTKTAEITVNKLKTSVSGVKVTTTYGTSKNLVITLKDVKDNLLAGKYVTVVLGGTTYKNKLTNSKGQITIAVPKNLVPKTYAASITFDGDRNYAKSTGSVNVEVKKATPKLTATKKTFKKSVKTKKYTVTLKDNSGKVMKNTKVTLKVKGKTYKATTNAKGKATFKIKNLKKKGKFTATVKFAGNVYYNAATKKVKIIVK